VGGTQAKKIKISFEINVKVEKERKKERKSEYTSDLDMMILSYCYILASSDYPRYDCRAVITVL